MCQITDPFLSVYRNRGHTVQIEFLAIRTPVAPSVTWQSHTLCELRYERPKKSIEWVKMIVLFFSVCGPNFTKFDCSFQCRFPIDDILLPSGDIRDQIAK